MHISIEIIFSNFIVDWVKARMKALRTSYTQMKKPSPSGSARKNPTKKSTWLVEKLKFLDPYIATRTPVSNIDAVTVSAVPMSNFVGWGLS